MKIHRKPVGNLATIAMSDNEKFGNMRSPICVTIVFMGDSITGGQYVDPAYRWTTLVSNNLDQEFFSTSVKLRFLNQGISGETSRQALERYPAAVQSHYPDVLTLQFGLNDCNCWVTDRGSPRVSEAAYRANIVEMIDRARRFVVGHIILSTNHQTLRQKILPSGESLETRRKRYNALVREVAAETGVTLCDIDTAFAGFSAAELEDLLLPYPDHVHLSCEGHRLYAKQIEPLIKNAIVAMTAEQRLTK